MFADRVVESVRKSLFQLAHTQIATETDLSLVRMVLARDQADQ